MTRQLLGKRRIYHGRSQVLETFKSYDESGQIFTEQTYEARPMRATWTRKTRGSSKEHKNFVTPGPGCAPLWDAALRSLLLNLDLLTSDILAPMPLPILERLWKKIELSELDSFCVWKAFACAVPAGCNPSFAAKAQIIARPDTEMIDYATSLSTPSLTFITSLIIWNIPLPKTDLINISKITNLGSLIVGSETWGFRFEVGLDDQIVRAWSRAAQEAGAFSQLRFFACAGENQVTSRIYEYLTAVPSLCFISINTPKNVSIHTPGVEKCPANGHTWSDAVPYIHETIGDSGSYQALGWNSQSHNLYRMSGSHLGKKDLQSKAVAAKSLPFFTLCMGSPPNKHDFERMRICFRVPIQDVPDRFNLIEKERREMFVQLPGNEGPPSSEPPAKRTKLRSSKIRAADMSLFQ